MADSNSTNWEDIIDDSDLISSVTSLSSHPLRPCSSSSSSSSSLSKNPSVHNPRSVSPRLIPGPAGPVQAAMHRIKRRDGADMGSQRGEVRGIAGSMDLDEEVDDDFNLDSWIYAMRFLGRESDSVSPIASIKTSKIRRIPLVVGLVNSCTPNGLGDLVLTLKDQTGTICASIHHNALSEGTLQSEVAVGCVLILQQVVVFSPARSIQYLNVTKDNVVKLIGKNCGPPQEHFTPSIATKLQENGTENDENRQMEQPLVNNGIENHTEIRTSANQEITNKRVDFCGIISQPNPKESEASTLYTNCIPKHHQTRPVEPARDPQVILRKISGDASFRKISKENTSVKILKENLRTKEENEKQEKLVSKASYPEWTDEQISELFADY
ncbi:hypothetical protein LUZ63_004377 [Rhynchospora breviuscula]|uniref:Homologous recombination OB-fold protein OB-fold domain-containing protein n=1 Tax=Rhynchospora breviuscula TaxID=2022672 RepID=A0A9Q0D342_9POAL|nr:hypothetical protein LUZ63_004377 [Rhynchospora breviuscula]